MVSATGQRSGIRRGEVIAALSLATDLSMGQPVEFALKSCVLGMRLGEVLGLAEEDMAQVYYQSLLRYVGCNSEVHALAAMMGDEFAFRRDFALIDTAKANEMGALVFGYLRRANAGAGPLAMTAAIAHGLFAGKKASAESIAGHCEVAERLAERLGLSAGVQRSLGQIYERWDGRGMPRGLKGEAISPAVRVVVFAQDAIVLSEAHGGDGAFARLKQRRGTIYDPRIVDLFFRRAEAFMRGLEDATWETVLALEPSARADMSAEEFDAACLAMADFTDLKSPYMSGHSRAVSALAGEAARQCGLTADDAVNLTRAGLLHDIGQVAISARIWIKSSKLNDSEWEQVRLHPYYGERVLARPPALALLGAIIGQHHERCDGSGYHRGTRTGGLTAPGRILAAAEAYQGMIEHRPHRAALSGDAAAAALKREVRDGRLDGDATTAVLAAAGHRVSVKRELVAGLTSREIEVLRGIARGQSMKEMARTLGISPKTVDNHTQNVYAKIGVKTRGGATLFAIEHGLAGPVPASGAS
jgi:HD-GYP domain-containing protein (c-di-GMP phosphodiesterase class II)